MRNVSTLRSIKEMQFLKKNICYLIDGQRIWLWISFLYQVAHLQQQGFPEGGWLSIRIWKYVLGRANGNTELYHTNRDVIHMWRCCWFLDIFKADNVAFNWLVLAGERDPCGCLYRRWASQHAYACCVFSLNFEVLSQGPPKSRLLCRSWENAEE